MEVKVSFTVYDYKAKPITVEPWRSRFAKTSEAWIRKNHADKLK